MFLIALHSIGITVDYRFFLPMVSQLLMFGFRIVPYRECRPDSSFFIVVWSLFSYLLFTPAVVIQKLLPLDIFSYKRLEVSSTAGNYSLAVNRLSCNGYLFIVFTRGYYFSYDSKLLFYFLGTILQSCIRDLWFYIFRIMVFLLIHYLFLSS